MTGSISGLYGNEGVGNYSVAKNGLVGLSNVAAIEGAAYGVKSNVILPAAVTRMSEGVDTSAFPPMDPDLVAPAVAWLCHESCSITGEMLISAVYGLWFGPSGGTCFFFLCLLLLFFVFSFFHFYFLLLFSFFRPYEHRP